jgi:hypothetical protein
MRLNALLVLAPILLAQQSSGPAGTKGMCSPAVTGNTNTFMLTCAGLTPAQQRLLESVPMLLNKLLASQIDDTAEILSRLDGCIDIASQAQKLAVAAARGVIKTYSFDGSTIRVRDNASSSVKMTVGDVPQAFRDMQSRATARQWDQLVKLCDEQIKAEPEWLTPYFFKAVAELSTGQRDTAISLLKFVRDQSGGNPEYSRAGELLDQLGAH